MHEYYFARCLATLKERDVVLNARRKQIDPKTGCQTASIAAASGSEFSLTIDPPDARPNVLYSQGM
jgi:hypothetical protein